MSDARGRNRISPKALNRVVCAVVADELQVSASGVTADLVDSAGLLALTVRTPIRTVGLTAIVADPDTVARAGGSLVTRAETGRAHIRRRVSELTGAEVSRVTVRLTRPDIQREERVR